jgi:hypothetical protein
VAVAVLVPHSAHGACRLLAVPMPGVEAHHHPPLPLLLDQVVLGLHVYLLPQLCLHTTIISCVFWMLKLSNSSS